MIPKNKYDDVEYVGIYLILTGFADAYNPSVKELKVRFEFSLLDVNDRVGRSMGELKFLI